MPQSPTFDGPRRILRSELRAAERLDQICFNLSGEAPAEDSSADADSPLPQEAGETYVITADGRPVSLIGTFQERIHAFDGLIRAGYIGGVCTHPDYRGCGLATQLMDHCTRKLVEGGARLMLISGGRGLYTRLGNVPAGKYASFSLRPGQMAPAPRSVTLRRVTKEDAERDAMLCSRLYASEPVRFERKMEHYRDHIRDYRPWFYQEEWVVEMDGRPEAYLRLITDWQFVNQPELGQRRLDDYAGSRVALASALSGAVEQNGIQLLEASIPWQDADLIRLLREMGARPEWTALDGHTMRIINFPGLLGDLRAYVQARLSPEMRRGLRFEQTGPLLGAGGGDRCAIVRGKDRLELDGAQMTALVMGSPEIPPAFPGALDEIIPALFPLPSFLPGLNYH